MPAYRVMSQNLRYDTSGVNALEIRGPRLSWLLDKYRPDTIGFQEGHAPVDGAGCGGTLPAISA